MAITRVACFIDGFNLYHAIKDLRAPHLKWVNLRRLSQRLVAPKSESLVAVYYFSAFANWLAGPRARHEVFVAAQLEVGVIPVMGHFKEKSRRCPKCAHAWVGHEEKETDVSIALHMVNEARKDSFDVAMLISRDSDLAPALRMIQAEFPRKTVRLVAPPNKGHSADLLRLAASKTKITRRHLEESLLPSIVNAQSGTIVAVRPAEYDPPA